MRSPLHVRRERRAARRALSPREQRRHATALARRLSREPSYLRARRIAAYWPADGELDPRLLMWLAARQGKSCHLPVVRGFGRCRLWFVRYRPGDPLCPNRFGIPEPRRRGSYLKLAGQLDLLLVPLVAFDADGNRLGMGGGCYDRTLAYLRQRRHWRRPRLFGVAHECQRLERIEPRAWDIPLDAIFTERHAYFRPRPL